MIMAHGTPHDKRMAGHYALPQLHTISDKPQNASVVADKEFKSRKRFVFFTKLTSRVADPSASTVAQYQQDSQEQDKEIPAPKFITSKLDNSLDPSRVLILETVVGERLLKGKKLRNAQVAQVVLWAIQARCKRAAGAGLIWVLVVIAVVVLIVFLT